MKFNPEVSLCIFLSICNTLNAAYVNKKPSLGNSKYGNSKAPTKPVYGQGKPNENYSKPEKYKTPYGKPEEKYKNPSSKYNKPDKYSKPDSKYSKPNDKYYKSDDKYNKPRGKYDKPQDKYGKNGGKKDDDYHSVNPHIYPPPPPSSTLNAYDVSAPSVTPFIPPPPSSTVNAYVSTATSKPCTTGHNPPIGAAYLAGSTSGVEKPVISLFLIGLLGMIL
jgi:hypothetical protein